MASFNDLDEGLVWNILLKASAASMVACASVCIHWRALVKTSIEDVKTAKLETPAAFESLVAFHSHSAGLVEKLKIHLTAEELESEAALFLRSCKSVKELDITQQTMTLSTYYAYAYALRGCKGLQAVTFDCDEFSWDSTNVPDFEPATCKQLSLLCKIQEYEVGEDPLEVSELFARVEEFKYKTLVNTICLNGEYLRVMDLDLDNISYVVIQRGESMDVVHCHGEGFMEFDPTSNKFEIKEVTMNTESTLRYMREACSLKVRRLVLYGSWLRTNNQESPELDEGISVDTLDIKGLVVAREESPFEAQDFAERLSIYITEGMMTLEVGYNFIEGLADMGLKDEEFGTLFSYHLESIKMYLSEGQHFTEEQSRLVKTLARYCTTFETLLICSGAHHTKWSLLPLP